MAGESADQGASSMECSPLEQAVRALLEHHLSERDKTHALIKRLRTGRLSERARRHLEGLTLKSTYNSERIQTLRALEARLLSELGPLLDSCQRKLMQLEITRYELELYVAAERAVEADRAAKATAGMYAEPQKFVDLLYREFDVNRGHFAALEPEDVEAIARILLERGDPHMTREAIRSTARDAQNFHRR